MKLTKYDDYETTLSHGFTSIPAHWKLVKLKHVARMRSGENITAENFIDGMESTFPVYGGNGKRGHTDRYTHDGEYVLIGRQGALCGNIHFVRGKFWASEHAVVAELLNDYNVRWFGQLLTAMELGQYSQKAAQPGLAMDFIGNLVAPVPSVSEQETIANFLDVATGKIDALVAKKRELIERLEEKRRALITRCVTRGLPPEAARAARLNPHPKLKPSDIQWLGEIPEHWDVTRVKYVSRVDTGGTPSRSNDAYWDGDVLWVKTGEVNYQRIVSTAETISELGLRESAAKLAPAGTLLMALYGEGVTRGRVAILGVPATYNQACAAMRFDPTRIHTEFAQYCFMSVSATNSTVLSSGLFWGKRLASG